MTIVAYLQPCRSHAQAMFSTVPNTTQQFSYFPPLELILPCCQTCLREGSVASKDGERFRTHQAFPWQCRKQACHTVAVKRCGVPWPHSLARFLPRALLEVPPTAGAIPNHQLYTPQARPPVSEPQPQHTHTRRVADSRTQIKCFSSSWLLKQWDLFSFALVVLFWQLLAGIFKPQCSTTFSHSQPHTLALVSLFYG